MKIKDEGNRWGTCTKPKILKIQDGKLNPGNGRYKNRTPCHYAAKHGHTDIVKLLSGRLEDLNLPDGDSVTPLHFAANQNHLEICQIILEKAKEKNPKDINERTPYFLAAMKGHIDIVKLLIDNVDNVNPIGGSDFVCFSYKDTRK